MFSNDSDYDDDVNDAVEYVQDLVYIQSSVYCNIIAYKGSSEVCVSSFLSEALPVVAQYSTD